MLSNHHYNPAILYFCCILLAGLIAAAVGASLMGFIGAVLGGITGLFAGISVWLSDSGS